jgi:hypothetical protein
MEISDRQLDLSRFGVDMDGPAFLSCGFNAVSRTDRAPRAVLSVRLDLRIVLEHRANGG